MTLEPKQISILADFFHYSFKDVDFQFDELTPAEKKIFGDKATFESILKEFPIAPGPLRTLKRKGFGAQG